MSIVIQNHNINESLDALRLLIEEIDLSQQRGDLLKTVELAEGLEDLGAAVMWSAVANARTVPGVTWAEIGGKLRLTRQAVQQRFGTTDQK
jgi:hypothetical protein